MTHDELLAKIHESIKGAEFEERWMWTTSAKALRAVVDLHKPVQSYMFYEEACSHCSSEEDRLEIVYPCKTIQAIEKELG